MFGFLMPRSFFRPAAIRVCDSIHSESLAHGFSDQLQRIAFRCLHIEHSIEANTYCQARVRICPADRSAGAGMADDVRIAADDRGRRGRLTAQVEASDAQVDHP